MRDRGELNRTVIRGWVWGRDEGTAFLGARVSNFVRTLNRGLGNQGLCNGVCWAALGKIYFERGVWATTVH